MVGSRLGIDTGRRDRGMAKEYLDLGDLRQHMGRAARARIVANFGYDTLARGLEAVYRRALWGESRT